MMYAAMHEDENRPLNRKFVEYHESNPQIYDLFCKYTLQLISSGRTHYGAKGIIERIRFHTAVVSDEILKVNNNYTAGYARLFERDFPQYEGFFKKRELKSSINKD